MVSLDIFKAYDHLWFGAMLLKLIAFGVANDFFKFISSFLRDRNLRVVGMMDLSEY